jgi:ubiquinone/menaquinone biosynthesis C-methylase UbiE
MSNDFDKHAKNYDATFTYSAIGKAQRDRVYHFLNKCIQNNNKLNILEINCGTGEDARYLSEKKHRVLATDISSEMIKTAKEKHQTSNLKFQVVDITKITSDTFSEKFDLIFSNFGGLNCLSKLELESFLKKSESLLNPYGKIALVLMPKICLWELFYFSLKGDFKNAHRRNTSDKVIANVEGVEVSTWYYNPKDIEPLVSGKLKKILLRPIGIKIPPSYLESFFSNKKWFLKLLVWAEKLFPYSIWAKYADHYLIIFEKE